VASGDLIAVTGATGGVGGRLARRLADQGRTQRLVVRDPARAPELPGAEVVRAEGYHDAEGMTAALAGARTLFLVSAHEDPDRVALHTTAVDAAVAAGVERIVYTSFLGASPTCTFTFGRDHWATEEHIRRTPLAWTFLRDSMYVDFVPGTVGADGVIRGPAGAGRCASVARDDVADVALAAVTDDAHAGRAYELTGPEALTMAELAEVLAELSGRPVRFEDETLEQAYASRAGLGAAPFEVEGWVTSYLAIARGELDVVSDAVQRVAGHPPQDLRAFAAAHPEALAALRNL
jgi:NAD(P)H dehydrogenase (quinone)